MHRPDAAHRSTLRTAGTLARCRGWVDRRQGTISLFRLLLVKTVDTTRPRGATTGIIEIGSTPDSCDRRRARPDQTRRLREAGAGQPGHACAPEAVRERTGAGLSRGTFRRETRRGPGALAPPRKRRASLSLQRFLLRFGDVELFSDHGHTEHTSRIFSGGLQGKRGRRSFATASSLVARRPVSVCVGARTPYSLWNNTVSV